MGAPGHHIAEHYLLVTMHQGTSKHRRSGKDVAVRLGGVVPTASSRVVAPVVTQRLDDHVDAI